MTLAIGFLLLLPLWILSFRNVSLFIVANVAMYPVLATYDRLVGGITWDYSVLRIPLFLTGLVYIIVFKKKLPIINKRTAAIIIAVISFALLTQLSTLFRGSLKDWVTGEFLDFGFMYMPLMLLIPATMMDSAEISLTLKRIALYVLVPCALFGIFQYYAGPDKIASMGFTIITPNTADSPYIIRFREASRASLDGLRTFSFFPTPPSYSAMMFHGFLWMLAFLLKERKWWFYLILLSLFGFALVMANFVTLTIMAIASIGILSLLNSSKKSGWIRNIGIVALLVAFIGMVPIFLPFVAKKIIARTDISFSTAQSVAGRYDMITNYPRYQRDAPFYGYGEAGMKHLPFRFTSDQRILYNALRYGPLASLAYLCLLIFIAISAVFRISRITYGTLPWKLLFIVVCMYIMAIVGELGNGLIPQTGPSNIVFWFLGGIPFMKPEKLMAIEQV